MYHSGKNVLQHRVPLSSAIQAMLLLLSKMLVLVFKFPISEYILINVSHLMVQQFSDLPIMLQLSPWNIILVFMNTILH